MLDDVEGGDRSHIMGFSEATEQEELSSNDYMRQRRAHFVSYEAFLERYWPHFPQNHSKSFGRCEPLNFATYLAEITDPALVYAEIIGD